MTGAAALLGPEGPLARALAGYEHRAGQLDMVAAAERALREDRVLLCEAGTGTGKTLAYLVPAILSGRKVVVSTATRALQEQIFFRDLPLIERHLGLDTRAVLVKGLGNYLCLRRYEEWRAQRLAHDADAARLEAWAAETPSGDIAELAELSEAHPLWREVVSSSETRVGQGCPHFEACHVTRLKRAAEEARLLVVNHHLFFADLAIKGDHRGGALPPYDAVVLDEAHKIEDIAAGFFGVRVSSASFEKLLRDAERTGHARGWDDAALCARIGGEAQALFAACNLRCPNEGREPLPADLWQGARRERYHALDDALAALEGLLRTREGGEVVLQLAARLARVRSDFAELVEGRASRVAWIERRGSTLALSATPVDVGPILRERLWSRGGAAILTSATLGSAAAAAPEAAHFEFARSRLGLDAPIELPVDELVVPGAFDYAARALLYLPADMPDVDDRAFSRTAATRVAELLSLGRGGGFVLCTSLRSMRAIAGELAARLAEPPLVQGDAPKSVLLERFRTHGSAVLCATMSFWEGVDVPGSALGLVVVDRLPFGVPSDPIFAARCAALERAGRAPFAEYAVPAAAILLKQGFGRLLRTRRDAGVVAILDRRAQSRAYGQRLLAALPPAPRTDELEEVRAFWTRVTDSGT